MASPSLLTFDAEGRAVDFDVWLDDLQLFLQCDSKDGLSLFDLTSAASTAPAAEADNTVRSQWLTRDAAARHTVRSHLPSTERAHFSQYKSAKTLYDAVVARYSSPATAALSRLMLLYLFPDLAAFATVTDLITHLRTSDTRYRAALPAEFLRPEPPPPSLHLLLVRGAASARASGARALEEVVGAAGVAVEAEEGVGVRVVAEVGASVAAGEVEAAVAVAGGVEEAEVAAAEVELAEAELCSGDPSSSSALVRPRRPSSFVSGVQGARGLGYAVSISAEGDCYVCVPPDPGIEAAALGARESTAPSAKESAALGAGESALSGTASAQVLHTFTLDSGASRSFFQDRTTLTPLSRPVAVALADPSGGPVLARYSTVLPCPAVPSGSLSGLYLPSFSTNLVSGADLQDAGVDQFTARVLRRAATWPPTSSQKFAAASRSGPESAPCSCRLLSHQTLLWHHRLGHPSLPRLRGMASRVLVSGLPRSLPPLPPGPDPTYVPCVEGRQRAVPHSSEFPPTEAPLQTLHMDVWGLARVRGQGHEHYFLLVVDDYSRYTTVFPLPSKGEISSDLLRAFCRAEGIRQTFTLPASPQQNGIAERRIGMVMDVARTSMIHAAAPHFLWPFAVQYAAHQINLQPRVSLPETSPTLRWTGKVGDASAFRVWGSRAFVRDLFADKLSSRAVPCVFLGFPPDAPEMASWKSTGTYVDAVPPPGANIVSGMWIFRVKRPPGSPPVFEARYVARGFSQRQGVDYFQTFSPTPKMTTLRILLHVAAHRDYKLHSLDFSTAFLQGSLHEEIWLRRPLGFTGTFPPGTQWSLRRPVYGLRQAPREWHDTLRTTLAALGFAPSTADLSLFLRTDTSLPPFYILVYVDDLVFATADTAGLAHVKSELQKRHTCTDLGELRSYLGLQITRDRARRTITLTQSHMVQQVL
ncbi:unnamed protein product [Closterium sp. NIES-54]